MDFNALKGFNKVIQMEKINKRLSIIEKSISEIVSSLKKIEDVSKKSQLKHFSIKQLIKWLNDNEVEYQTELKENLVDIVWDNLNEWEWEYYDDENENDENEENDENSQENDQENEEENEEESDDQLSDVSESEN